MVKGSVLEEFKVNFPFASVTVPALSPTTWILAPGMGRLLLSATVPVTVFWANAMPQKSKDRIKR